jgi:PucR C-terminal helix-turn-helix domain/GGDEF-like domain
MEQLAAGLAARRDELLGAAMASILERVPGYRTAGAALLADVRGHIAAQYDLFCAVLARDRPVQPRETAFIARHAALRARRGISLIEFLEAFRCFHNVMWDAIVADGGDDALAGARALLTFVDLATTQAGNAYVEAQQLLVADSDRVRRDLLEDLLAGQPPSTAAGLAAAREAGLEGDAPCLVVAAVPVSAPEEDGELRRAATRLARALGPRALAVTRRAEVVVVTGDRPAPGRALAPAATGLAVGVSTPHALRELGAAYREAWLALRTVADGGVRSLPDTPPFDYLMLRDDDVARRLIDPEIVRFVQEDRAHGGALTRTLEAYAAADLNAKAAAEELLIHVNTAHHRLGRIEEKTGRDLRRLSDVIDLLIAVRLVA